MPRTLFDCIGDWFEDILLKEFPDFRKVDDQNGTIPDLYNDSFHIEAKVGYYNYGAQLKGRQVEKFCSDDKPIVYAIGFHNLEGLRTSTLGMTEDRIDNFLCSNAGIHSAYFVSNSVIKKMWRKEHHTAEQNSEWKYFSVKRRHFEAIIQNLNFTRSQVVYTPSNYYRISLPTLLLQSAPLLEGRRRRIKFGAILDKKSDAEVIQYLRENRAIN